MNGTLKKAVLIFFRVFFVVLCFTVDVKVRADVIFNSVAGQVEVEKDGALASTTTFTGKPQKLMEPLDVQTFAGGSSKLAVNSVELGLGEKTLVSIAKEPRFSMSWGTVFISSPIKENDWLTFRTPQGEVVTSGGEFLLEVASGKLNVSVVSGRLELKDRAAQKTILVRAGYAAWIGGLTASGTHAAAEPAALDFEKVMGQLKVLGSGSGVELQSRYDHLRPLWKQAVFDVAQEDQDRVMGDLQLLQDLQEAETKRENRHKKEQARLRTYFRERNLDQPKLTGPSDEPDENTEDPSGSAPSRVPTSTDE